MRSRLDGMTLAGLAVLVLFAASVVRNWTTAGHDVPDAADLAASQATATAVAATAIAATAEAPATPPPGDPAIPGDPAWHTAISVPYDDYFLTQGLHGASYGHLAVDIAAGNGEIIKSIINGTVTATGYDQWGNTYIQIENDVYAVLYLHGAYSLVTGDAVTAGQPIGTESNIGYTLDMYGNLCAGRDCGYHTHLNVYDKRIAGNIDPLSLIPANYP